ncbi:sensor histidine kinase [Streptomyces sp. GKU 257-1]|nr:sensor histidine kinase [Streptomyces sp. GKU 257-1]
MLEQVSDAVTKERLRVDGAAQASMRGATTTIQALLYQLQTRLQTMQERYDDPFVAEDLLAADFLNEQALRRIQSTAIVCGAWPGLTRQNSHLGDIVVGAMSRLSGYERVQVTNQLRDPVGVVARAVEPGAVVLTELLANALHYSHPELPVAVTIQQGNRGASVIIDDAGVGMHAEELERAQRMMSGQENTLLTELGDPPKTGFAAVGQLARQYGFTTSVEPSPYGGVRAIVHIPGDPLLTLLDEEEQPMSPMAPVPRSNTSAAPPVPSALPGHAVPPRPPPGRTGGGHHRLGVRAVRAGPRPAGRAPPTRTCRAAGAAGRCPTSPWGPRRAPRARRRPPKHRSRPGGTRSRRRPRSSRRRRRSRARSAGRPSSAAPTRAARRSTRAPRRVACARRPQHRPPDTAPRSPTTTTPIPVPLKGIRRNDNPRTQGTPGRHLMGAGSVAGAATRRPRGRHLR